MPTTVETLTLPNYLDINILEEFDLSADAAAAQAVFSLLNPSNAAVNDYVALNPGSANGELKKILSISGNDITATTALGVLHRNHERVVKLYGSKIRVKRAPDVDGTIPADSAFTTLATLTIDPDQPFSYYTDSAGGSGFWYKFVYYNDVLDSETELAIMEAVRGGGYGHYVSLADIRAEAGLIETKKLDEAQVAQRRDEAEAEIKGALAAAGYVLPLQTTNNVPYAPPLVRGVARLLAAGLILSQNFGTAKPSSAKDGKTKQDSARNTLKMIQDNKIALLDTNEQVLLKPALVDGWPDETTADVGTDGVNGEPARARMDKVF